MPWDGAAISDLWVKMLCTKHPDIRNTKLLQLPRPGSCECVTGKETPGVNPPGALLYAALLVLQLSIPHK